MISPKFFIAVQLLLVLTISIQPNVRAAAPVKGAYSLKAGIGAGSTWHIGATETLTPPVFARINFVLRDDIGPGNIVLGAQLSYDSHKWQTTSALFDTYGWKQSRILVGLLGEYHYTPFDKVDVYGMLMIGWRFVQSSQNGNWPDNPPFSPSKTTFSPGLSFGAKYQLLPKWGVFIEAGYNTAYLMGGIQFDLFQP